jgi:hypothetical protein
MRSFTYIIIGFLFLLTACNKDEFYGEFPLGDELRFILPQSDTLNYFNADSTLNKLVFDASENYFYRDVYDEDGRTTYTADFEIYTKYYTSPSFNLYYYLYVKNTAELHKDILDISIKDNAANKITELHIEMPLVSYQTETIMPNIEFIDSIVVNEHTLYDVYFLESDGEAYYLKEGKGLVAFDLGNNSWIIPD